MSLETLLAAKTEKDTQWQEKRRAEREDFMGLRDASVEQITSDPEFYSQYLNLQSSNPTYSAGNLAAALIQRPDISVLGTVDFWQANGRSVTASERSGGVKIFVPTGNGKFYDLSTAYDISQTTGRQLNEYQLSDNTPQMNAALESLLEYMTVVANDKLEVPALYDASDRSLHVNPAYADSEAFPAIVTEAAHAHFSKKPENQYVREESELDAQSVSYIVSKRYGVTCKMPDLSKLDYLYEGWDAEDRRHGLDGIQECAKKMCYKIDKAIAPQQRNRVPPKRPTR